MKFRETVEEVREGLRRLGLNPSCPVVEGELDNCVGEYDPNVPAMITIKRGLTGQRLWRVILHEYGHFFGLGHTRAGLMHYRSITRADKHPAPASARQKKAWCLEIANLVLERKAKLWHA